MNTWIPGHNAGGRSFAVGAAVGFVALVATATASPAAADGSVERGATVFNKCKACHEVGEGARNKVGPRLTGVVGRPAGSVDGFQYGSGMAGARGKGLVWDEAALFDYLADPRKFLRAFTGDDKAKAKMPLRLKDEADRRDVIAYLKTFE